MPDWPVDIFRPPLGLGPTVLLLLAAAVLGVYVHLQGVRWLGRRKRGATLWPSRSDRDGQVCADKTHLASSPPEVGTPSRCGTQSDETQPFWQRAALIGLRVAALAALAWMLAGPSRYRSLPDTAQPLRIEFLLDTSASMNEKDVTLPPPPERQPATRWEAVRRYWLDPALQRSLSELGRVELAAFDNGSFARSISLDEARALTPNGQATDFFGAVGRTLQTEPPGLLVLLSDGHDTQQASDPGVVEQARQSGWRIAAVPVGTGHTGPELSLAAWAADDRLYDGQSTTIHAAVSASGFGSSLPSVQVDLMRDGERVDTRQVIVSDRARSEAAFHVTPRAAPGQAATLASYEVVVRPVEGQKSTQNNKRWVFINVQRDRIRVVLLEAQPYWDTRFLAQTLRDDAQVDLTAVYALGPDRTVTTYSAGGVTQSRPPLPVPLTPGASGALKDFDVVVLGKGAELFFPGTQAQMLVDFVQAGGSLVLARGQAFDPSTESGREAQKIIAPIEPVEWGRQTLTDLGLEVTAAGRASPLLDFERLGKMDAVLTRLPDMLAATKIAKEKSLSVVLLRQVSRQLGANPGAGTPSPGGEDAAPLSRGERGQEAALAYQNVGSGRVFAVLTEGLWRWAFLPSRQGEYDSVYQMFWAKTVRWLAGGGEFLPGQSVSLTLGKLAAEPGESVLVSVATRYLPEGDFQPQLRVTEPGGMVRDIALTHAGAQSPRYEGVLQTHDPGVYEVQLQAPQMGSAPVTSRLAVYDRSIETADTSARPQNLVDLSDATGGECLSVNEPGRLLPLAAGLKQVKTPDRTTEYVFDQPLLLAAVAALWTLDWLLRRRWGRA